MSKETSTNTPNHPSAMGPQHGPRFRDHTKATMKGMARIEITPDRVSPIDFQPATPPPIDIRQGAHNRLGGGPSVAVREKIR
jgi:hypothetical protein